VIHDSRTLKLHKMYSSFELVVFLASQTMDLNTFIIH